MPGPGVPVVPAVDDQHPEADADQPAAAAAGGEAAFQKDFAAMRTMLEMQSKSFQEQFELLSKEVKAKRKNDEIDSRFSKRRTTLQAVRTENPAAGNLLRAFGAQVDDLKQAEAVSLKLADSVEDGNFSPRRHAEALRATAGLIEEVNYTSKKAAKQDQPQFPRRKFAGKKCNAGPIIHCFVCGEAEHRAFECERRVEAKAGTTLPTGPTRRV